MMLSVPNIDIFGCLKERIEFELYGTKTFDLIIDHLCADLNCMQLFNDRKISLLMHVALSDELASFKRILAKSDINVNCLMKYDIYLNNESESIIYNVLQYLYLLKKQKCSEFNWIIQQLMLKLLLMKTYFLYFWPSKHKTKR